MKKLLLACVLSFYACESPQKEAIGVERVSRKPDSPPSDEAAIKAYIQKVLGGSTNYKPGPIRNTGPFIRGGNRLGTRYVHVFRGKNAAGNELADSVAFVVYTNGRVVVVDTTVKR